MGDKNFVDLGDYKPVSLFSIAGRGARLIVVEWGDR